MPAIQLMTVSNTESTASVERMDTRQSKLEGIQAAFSNYMQQTSSNGAQVTAQQNAVPSGVSKTQNSGNMQQKYEQYQSKSAAQADKVSNADANTADQGTAAEAVENAAEEIKELIKENLGVDEEQLQQAMELLGLTQADLLDPKQLVALAVELTGSKDAGMMLFNGNFQNLLQEVSVVTEDLLQDLGMTMEQLMDQLTQAGQVQADDAVMQDSAGMTQAQGAFEQGAAAETSVQEAQPQDAQKVQEAPVQQQAQGTQTQAVQDVQPQEAVQAEEEPQEAGQLQEVHKEADKQSGQQEYKGTGDANAEVFGNQEQENPRFEFHANVHHEQRVDTPVAQNITNQTPVPQVNIPDVIQQIVEYTRTNLTEHVKTIEMQLNPENLGKVYLHISEKQGAVTAQITAQNESLKEALVQQAAVLKENLNNQGIKVEAVEVSVGTHEFESNLEKDARQQEEQARQQEEQNARRSRRSINLNELEDLDGISGLMSEEEALVAQIMKDNGNNVDYKA